MNLLTILEIAGNYPQDILINSAKQTDGSFTAFMYMLRDGTRIHKLMLDWKGFESREKAISAMTELAEECVKKQKEENLHPFF